MVSQPEGIDKKQDVQHVWVYCTQKAEVTDVLTCCSGSQRPQRQPHLCEKEGSRDWRGQLHAYIPAPPAPYGPGEWAEFVADAGALLTASHAARDHINSSKDVAEEEKSGGSTRWPPLFITDRPKLCQASTDILVKGALLEVAKLRENQLLPVVLSSDFGFLCGFLVEGAPIQVHESMVLPGGAPGRKAAGNSSGGRSTVEVVPGVRLQHFSVSDGSTTPGDTQMEGPGLFGARCIGLFADGSCAYSAVSPDGTRAVEAQGVWQVINGHVVVGGAEGHVMVSHVQLSRRGAASLKAVSYEEPIHISLEELQAGFEAPLDLSECIPRGGERLRLTLLQDQPPDVENGLHQATPSAPAPATQANIHNLDGTFNSAWDTTFGSSAPIAGTAALPNDSFMRTPVHALLSLVGSQNGQPPSRPELRPRLVGLQRGLTPGPGGRSKTPLPWKPPPMQTLVEGSAPDPPPSPMMQKLNNYASSSASRPAKGAAQAFPTCPVQPGTYTCELTRPGDSASRSFELTLRPNGHCTYCEMATGSSIRSVPGTSVWRVEGSNLILDSLKGGAGRGFILRLQRGSRSVEHQVAQVRISWEVVLANCKYEPFPQQLAPFPGHVAVDASKRIFGLVDPDSPVLMGLKCRPDRLPFHGFQDALRRHNLPLDEILSDFRFIDRDADGQLSLADMHTLESYGTPVASPELLHDFREALVLRYSSLADAFTAMQESAGSSAVALPAFEKFLVEVASAPPQGKSGGDYQKLAQWMEKTTPELRETVFASVNPNGSAAIEAVDFLSLHLHTAVLAARRLEHFQTWIYENFGRTTEVFRRIFLTLDEEQSGVLTRKVFVDGAKSLGYPCDTTTTRSMFSLLDRNFDGKVSLQDFQKLLEFDGENILKDLDALKQMSDEKFGGADACFKRFLEREKKSNNSSSMPKAASFEAVQKICTQAQFGKLAPNADLTLVFLFLSEASGKQANGYLTQTEWALLKGFGSRALTGSPARLRKILEEHYGGMEQAFQRMHSSWLKRALVKGLKQTALAGLAHALCEEGMREGVRRSQERVQKGNKVASAAPRALPRQNSKAKLGPEPDPKDTKGSRFVSHTPEGPTAAMGTNSDSSSMPALSREQSSDQFAPRRHRLVGFLPAPANPSQAGQVSAVNWSNQ